ncbi:MAG: response regulator, partial [Candidatus Omnitrophica bacterium]|nr:response regulator [Candidatus Omnitrophota bacterium]
INFDVELANARDLAESARKMKSQFLGTISHELRTPLNGIIGLSNLLMETSEDSEHQTYCKMIEESGQSLMNIVNDILDSSRLDAGLIDLHLTEFDLARHIDETVGIVLPEAYERRIELSYYVDPNLLQPVVGDPGRLRQVLLNLFSNAVKFSDPGGEVSIHVERESWNNEASRIRFAVSDHGIGIPPERQQEIFERFVQVDASNTRKYGGIGVGLAVCQQLCALMGAQIEVSSTVGIGSLFEFVLEMATGESKAELQGIPKTFLENRNVVYVGDESNRSAVLVAYLERWGANFEWSMDLNSLNSTLEHGLDTHPPILILNTGVLAEEEKESIREFLRLVERESLNWISLFDPLASIESDSKLLTHADHVLELPVSRRGLKKSLLGLLGEDHPWDNCYCKSDRVFTQAGNKEPQEESVHLKILLAEDNPIHQKVTAKMLSKLGHHVTCCRNGSEAVNELQFSPYDVLLLDCLMPEMDGYETAARVRSMRSPLRGTPIIALTSDISYENREKCKQLGMNDFLSKPVRMESLVVSLTPYTEQKASHLDWVI